MKTRLILRLLFGLITLALMIFIFVMSHQNAEVSSGTSGSFISKVLDIFVSDFENLEATEQNLYVERFQHFFRKFAHFSLYAALGVLLCCFFLTFNFKYRKTYLICQAVGSLYAVSDEIHQLFIPGRSGQVSDVLLDSAGVLCGALFVLILLLIIISSVNKASLKKQVS